MTGLAAGIVLLGVLVFVHELGHFLVAKAFGCGVPVFSFGFGPRLLGFEWRGTDYRLSALPFGGYVRIAGADPFDDEFLEGEIDPDQHFMKKPVYQRLLVMLGGPVFNLVLPVIVFTGVLMAGEPHRDALVGAVYAGVGDASGQIAPGDRIVAADGSAVLTWEDLEDVLEERIGEPVTIDWLMATPDEMLERTGYPCGGTPPFGFEATFLIDPRVLEREIVYAGGGSESALIRLSPREMQRVNGGTLVRVRR